MNAWATAPPATAPNPNAPPTDTKDHAGWLDYWGHQLVKAVRAAAADKNPGEEDLSLRWAVHCAKFAYVRALRRRPSLRVLRGKP